MNDLSMAFDLASLLGATHGFSHGETGSAPNWGTEGSVEQQRLAYWSKQFSVLATSLPETMYATSMDNRYLDKFLLRFDHEPRFDDPLEGLGLASLFDLRDEWAMNGTPVQAEAAGAAYQAVNMGPDHVRIFDVERWDQPLVIVKAYQGYELWLTMAPRQRSELDMFGLALQLLKAPRKQSATYRSAQIPLLDLSCEPDLGWMHGLDLNTGLPGFDVIERAYQLVRVRTTCHDDLGSDVGFDNRRLEVNLPFMGFFVQTDPTRARDLPQGCFFAGNRSWKTVSK